MLALLAERHSAKLRRAWIGARAETARLRLAGGVEVTLLRPLTFMNLSGDAVRPFLAGGSSGPAGGRGSQQRDRFDPSDVILVYDDMDVPAGRLRLRPGGRPAGHRGVASVLSVVGADVIARVRVGIGRPAEGQDAAEYVLSDIPLSERPMWEASLGRAADAVEAICTVGIEAAMARFNPQETH